MNKPTKTIVMDETMPQLTLEQAAKLLPDAMIAADGDKVTEVTLNYPVDHPAGEPQDEEFDWSDSESVIIPEQPETAAYFNKRGELVIRQRKWPDDDPCIFISPTQIAKFLDKLTDVCGVPSVP